MKAQNVIADHFPSTMKIDGSTWQKEAGAHKTIVTARDAAAKLRKYGIGYNVRIRRIRLFQNKVVTIKIPSGTKKKQIKVTILRYVLYYRRKHK